MIITCKSCNTSFNLDETLVKQTGTKVRCSRCKHIFVVYPPAEKPQPPKPDETARQQVPEIDAGAAPDHAETDFAPQQPPKPADIQERTPEDDLADLDIHLDFDEGITGESKEVASEDFDLSELDKLFEGLEAPEPVSGKPTVHDTEPVAASEVESEEELDLSDLEKMLEIEETSTDAEEELDLADLDLEFKPQQDQEAETAVVSGELDLDLDMDLEGSEAVQAPSAADEINLSDLEMQLDTASPAANADETEIDLSDLGLDLQAGKAPDASGEGSEPESMDFDLDMDLGPETEAPAEKEINLSEIERLLETEGVLSGQKTGDIAQQTAAFSTEEISGGAKTGKAGLPDQGFSELDDMDLTPSAAAVKPHETKPEAVPAGKIAAPEPEEAVEAQAPKAQKKIGRAVMAFLILAILLVGGYGAVTILTNMGIQIPYVSELLKPEVKDTTGNLKIETTDINSKFIQNEKAGKLFVITGNVKNAYAGPRSFIRLTAKLFTKGKVLAASKTVYAGNVLSDLDLANQDMSAIDKKFENRFGDNRSNINLAPGAKEPFMAVFSSLPEKLEEFTIEVTGSLPGK